MLKKIIKKLVNTHYAYRLAYTRHLKQKRNDQVAKSILKDLDKRNY